MLAPMQLSTIAQRIKSQLSGDACFHTVSTDSRSLNAGDLFVGLAGEHFEGDTFVTQAVERGAVAAIVAHCTTRDVPTLVTDDTSKALGIIANENRRLFTGPVIGISGSTGKTSCKALLACILAELGNVLATQGNFNNAIGVPKTLLRLTAKHDFAVVEMGASERGDIADLCAIAQPDIALVTCAMPVHIESFGDIETIAQTKGELFAALPAHGIAVINADDPFFTLWCEQAADRRIISFSAQGEEADIQAGDYCLLTDNRPDKGMRFTLRTHDDELEIRLSLLGRHHMSNAIAASAAALALGVSLPTIQRALAAVETVPRRLQCVPAKGDFILIDDSYSANPMAVKAAIDVLTDFHSKTCLILGSMGELGEQAEALHADVATYAKQQGVKQLWVTGEWGEVMTAAFGAGSKAFPSKDALIVHFTEEKGTEEKGTEEHTIDADVVLVKGSRYMKMEQVVTALQADQTVDGKVLGAKAC